MQCFALEYNCRFESYIRAFIEILRPHTIHAIELGAGRKSVAGMT